MEQSISLVNQLGKIMFILPHNFLISDFGVGIRKYFADKKYVEQLIHFGSNKIFKEASTYTCIIGLSRKNNFVKYIDTSPHKLFELNVSHKIDYNFLDEKKWNLKALSLNKVFQKINEQESKVSDIFSNVSRGIVTGADKIFVLKGKIDGDIFYGFSSELNEKIEIESELLKPLLKGDSLSRYCSLKNDYYLIYPHKFDKKTLPYEEEELQSIFPKTYDYLSKFENKLRAKKVKYKTNPDYWYTLHNSRDKELLESGKILTPYISKKSQMTLDKNGDFFFNDKVSFLKLNDSKLPYEFFLAVFNSSLFWFYIKNMSSEFSGGYFAYTNTFIEPFPLPKIEENSGKINTSVKSILFLNKDLQELSSKFQRSILRKFPDELEKLPKKLQNWYELNFADFIKEFNKKLKSKGFKPLGLKKEAEWEDYFLDEQEKAMELKTQINQTDKKIDQMVYELYGLTEEEIEIVENS